MKREIRNFTEEGYLGATLGKAKGVTKAKGATKYSRGVAFFTELILKLSYVSVKMELCKIQTII